MHHTVSYIDMSESCAQMHICRMPCMMLPPQVMAMGTICCSEREHAQRTCAIGSIYV